MQAVTQHVYGGPEMLTVSEVERPTPGPRELLIEVVASPVTYGDRRVRGADYPGVMAVPGRLMMGVLKPRHATGGTMFAGRVAAVGAEVTRFAVGDDVFGSCDHGAWGEYIVLGEGATIAPMPAGLSHVEAAAMPYGALTALIFFRDHGDLQPGQRVLVVGAMGGVGRYAVQVARALGAEVTALCGAEHAEAARRLGAHHVIDRADDFTAMGQRWDLILDTPGAMALSRCKKALTPKGRLLTLHLDVHAVIVSMWSRLTGGPRLVCGVALGDADDMAQLAAMVEAGQVRGVVGQTFPLERIVEAHAAAERGEAVVVRVSSRAALRAAA